MSAWGGLAVELTACGWILALLAGAMALPRARAGLLWWLAMAGVAACGVALAFQHAAGGGAELFNMFSADGFARYFKALFLVTAAVVLVMMRAFQARLPGGAGAFYLLLFTAVLGTLVLASVQELLLLFLGLELLTFSLYIMAAYLWTDARAVEAGMKYLILGSVSSGFLVYGIALLYGAAGTTHFAGIAAALSRPDAPAAGIAGAWLVLAGLGFKVAAVPFQFWVPDVYEGAPTPVVAFLSVGSKAAGIVAMIRLLFGALLPLQPLWGAVLAALSAATLIYGNLGAIPQTNIKRLLGYSSIGHAGYLLMGLSTGTLAGAQAVGFYLLAYLVSNLAVFLAVVVASEALGGDRLDDYRGLSKRSPLLAAALFAGLLSLAGVPPLAGFVGKLLVLLRTVESGRLWLAAIGAANVAVSLYYYLMVIKRMYIDPPSNPAPIRVSALSSATLVALLLAILAIGIIQQPFLAAVPSPLHP